VPDDTIRSDNDDDTDEQPVGAAPVREQPPDNPEVPEADALEQADEVAAGPRRGRVSSDPEVPEADAWDQAQEVPLDDEGLGPE
jgi:hypothetical protein